jgi:hypothetical protein
VTDVPDRSVNDELRRRGYRPMVVGEHLDESMAADHLRVMVQVGMEHLARLGGAETGDFVTAEQVNRGLVEYLRARDRFGTGHKATEV